MTGEEIAKKYDLLKKYSSKPIPKLLKYIGKLDKIEKYDDFKKLVRVSVLTWILDYLIILPFIFFLCLSALSYGFSKQTHPLSVFLIAEGISIFWFLFINLIKDIKGVIKNG